MATIAEPASNTQSTLSLRRFCAVDYFRMIDIGVLGPKDHVELIGGIVFNMSPQGTRHNQVLMQLNRIFASLWNKAVIAIQATAKITENDVYDPDFMLLRPRTEGYKNHHPRPQDILLVAEAADSSMRRDRDVKLPVYATAGIPEYWIADLDRETLIIHREPEGGTYRAIETRRGDDVVSPSAAPELSFAVRQLFE